MPSPALIREAILALRSREGDLLESDRLLRGLGLTPEEIARRSPELALSIARTREAIHAFEAELIEVSHG